MICTVVSGSLRHDGVTIRRGQSIDLPDDLADRLVALGVCEIRKQPEVALKKEEPIAPKKEAQQEQPKPKKRRRGRPKKVSK